MSGNTDGGVVACRNGVVARLGLLRGRLLDNRSGRLRLLLQSNGRDLRILGSRTSGVLNNGTSGVLATRGSRVLATGGSGHRLTLAGAVGRGDNVGGDASNRAVGDRRRTLGDGVSGVEGSRESLRVVRRRVGRLGRAGTLGSASNGADSSVQGNSLGDDASNRAVGNRRRALGDGVDCGGKHGRGGQLGD